MRSFARDLDRAGNNHRVPDPERTGLINRLREEGVNLDIDRRSPVGFPAKATASILAPSGQDSPVGQEKPPATTATRTRKAYEAGEDGFSSDEEYEPPAKVNLSLIVGRLWTIFRLLAQTLLHLLYWDPEQEARLRPQSARFRPDQNKGNHAKEAELQRRKSAWSNLARPTTASFHRSQYPSADSPIAPLKPMSPARLSSGFDRLGQASSATALLERADDIIKKKSAQMCVPSPVIPTARLRKPELRNEDISFEDLSMQHDDHGVGNRSGNKVFAQRKITVSENEQLQVLLFGNSTRCFGDEWLQQSFEFSREDSDVAYGLKQLKGGPCGVLAVTQAYLLKNLLWPQGQLEVGDAARKLKPSDQQRRSALLAAIHEIVTRTNAVGPYKYVLGRIASKQRTAFTALTIYNLPDSDQLSEFLAQHQLEIFREGVAQLLISVVLSRGTETVRKDMDRPDHTLIGRHNHTSQEIVNLMLFGRAVSNLFDGEKDIGGTHLKGVPEQSHCGLLSPMEISGNIEVGSYLKSPKFPIWVVLAENHYFVLFATTSSVLTTARAFSLFVYDGMAIQDTSTVRRVDPSRLRQRSDEDMARNPIECCIRTKWKNASVEDCST